MGQKLVNHQCLGTMKVSKFKSSRLTRKKEEMQKPKMISLSTKIRANDKTQIQR